MASHGRPPGRATRTPTGGPLARGHRTARILVAGGGYVGLYTALRLERRLRPGEARVTLVTPDNFMTYQPLLPEVASGTLEPCHAVVPLRAALRRTRLIAGRLTGLDPARREAIVDRPEDDPTAYGYDHLVLGLGSVTRVLPVHGVAEHAFGFQTIAETMGLRDHVLERLEAAAATPDAEARRRALTFVFVGGGYAGIEALAELEDMGIADNIVASVRGGALRPFSYRSRGELITLGRHQGVGTLYGRRVRGLPAWLLRRAYYAARIPTADRKLRVTLDWLAGLPFRHDIVHFERHRRPREPIRKAADAA